MPLSTSDGVVLIEVEGLSPVRQQYDITFYYAVHEIILVYHSPLQMFPQVQTLPG